MNDETRRRPDARDDDDLRANHDMDDEEQDDEVVDGIWAGIPAPMQAAEDEYGGDLVARFKERLRRGTQPRGREE